MGWFDLIRAIEPFDELPLDRGLVAALEAEARDRPLGPLRFYTPSFRAYATDDLAGCGAEPVEDLAEPGPCGVDRGIGEELVEHHLHGQTGLV